MRWGLIGASTIAAEHMIGALRLAGQDVAMVQSGTTARANAFVQTYGLSAATTETIGSTLFTSLRPTKSTILRRWRRLPLESMFFAKSHWR
jgi:hypothetical protein